MRTSTRIGALGAATALVFVLAACGSNDAGSTDSSAGSSSTTSSSTPSSTPPTASIDAAHNDQDVMFAQQMIVHHKSAVDMAEMATTRASSQQVKNLAADIKAAQGPEIDTMTSWLKAWGEPVTATDSSMSGMDSSTTGSSTSMPGMMSKEQMSGLDAATGSAFDAMFLQLMTIHHQGTVEMATTEQAKGSNPQAIALAGEIESSQTAEVDQMKQMLTALG